MEQAQYDQILILGKKYMSEKKQEKRFKKEKKKAKGYIPKYLQWWSLGVGNTGYFVLLIRLVSCCLFFSKQIFFYKKGEKSVSLEWSL